MATIGSTALTLADWATRRDPDGKSATIVNLLSQTNEFIDFLLFREANGPTSHTTTVRTGLPSATWRQLNYGVAPTKSTTAKIVDGLGMLEAYSIVDKALADLEADQAEFRLSEALAFIEAMSQQMAQAVVYSNALATPQQIMGLSPRYSTVNTANAQTANNVIDAGGLGSTNTSIWVGVTGPNTLIGTFPKGSKVGLQHEDLGDKYAPGRDANGNPFPAYWDHFKWDIGLSVRDWRYTGRICNIDVTQLGTGNAANLINALIRMVNRLPTLPAGMSAVQRTDAPDGGQMEMGRPFILVNRTIRTYLELQALNKFNVLLHLDEWNGKTILDFRGIPILTMDALLNTEQRVT